MGPGIIWGIIIILIGVGLIFREIPVFRLIIGGLLVFWGISVIAGGFGRSCRWWKDEPGTAVFSDARFDGTEGEKEYNIVFGKGTFDFRNLDTTQLDKRIRIHTVFGGSEIRIDPSMPVRIRANAAFGGVKLPNGNTAAFGTTEYKTTAFDSSKPYLFLEIDAVFGGIEVRE
ncbi:MAG: hypothetical protein ACLFUC_09805 [Bacteroidales bacterium]